MSSLTSELLKACAPLESEILWDLLPPATKPEEPTRARPKTQPKNAQVQQVAATEAATATLSTELTTPVQPTPSTPAAIEPPVVQEPSTQPPPSTPAPADPSSTAVLPPTEPTVPERDTARLDMQENQSPPSPASQSHSTPPSVAPEEDERDASGSDDDELPSGKEEHGGDASAEVDEEDKDAEGDIDEESMTEQHAITTPAQPPDMDMDPPEGEHCSDRGVMVYTPRVWTSNQF